MACNNALPLFSKFRYASSKVVLSEAISATATLSGYSHFNG